MNAYQRSLKELIAPHLTNSVKAEQLLQQILSLNHETLERGRERLKETGVVYTNNAMLLKLDKEIGHE